MRNNEEYRKKIELVNNTPADELDFVHDEKIEAMTSEEFSNYKPEITGIFDEYILLSKRDYSDDLALINTGLDLQKMYYLFEREKEYKNVKLYRGEVRYCEIFGCPIIYDYSLNELIKEYLSE